MYSSVLCDPIRTLHAYPVSDGAVALLLASEEKAYEYTDQPIWITGFGNCMDGYDLGTRDLASSNALKKQLIKLTRWPASSSRKIGQSS